MPTGVPTLLTLHLLPCGKYSPNTPWPLPPPHPSFPCYSFGFTLLRFGACLCRRPAQGLFVNKLAINVQFGGKIVSFVHRLPGAARQGMAVLWGAGGAFGARGGLSAAEESAGSCAEGAAKGLRAWLAARPLRDGDAGTCFCANLSHMLLGEANVVLVCPPSRATLQKVTALHVVVVSSFSLSIFLSIIRVTEMF